MPTHDNNVMGVIGGAVVSLLSMIASFATKALPVVQFLAALVAIITGVVSTAWVIHRWNKGSTHE